MQLRSPQGVGGLRDEFDLKSLVIAVDPCSSQAAFANRGSPGDRPFDRMPPGSICGFCRMLSEFARGWHLCAG